MTKKIRFTKRFNKQLGKLSQPLQDQFWQRLELWQEQPSHSLLNNHGLSGNLKGKRSINITGDIRAIYEPEGNEIYLYEMIGTHAQLYGK